MSDADSHKNKNTLQLSTRFNSKTSHILITLTHCELGFSDLTVNCVFYS